MCTAESGKKRRVCQKPYRHFPGMVLSIASSKLMWKTDKLTGMTMSLPEGKVQNISQVS